MKSFFVLAAASLAVVNAVDCDLTVVAPLLTNPNVVQCKTETGLSPPTLPSDDVLTKVCGNSACKAGLAALKALGVGDCTALGVALESGFTKPIEAFCAKAAATPAPAGTTPAPTTKTPSTSATPTPATDSKTPAPSTDSKTPAPSTDSKTPAPTSGSGSKSSNSTKPASSSSSKASSGSDTSIEKTPVAGSDSGSGSLLDVVAQPVRTTAPATTAPASSASSVAFAASAVVLAVGAAFM
ncbi:Elicitin-like protein, partial [Globisporangium splendens]